MTAKHTPHTDALDTLGFVIGPNEKRDAIHLGVEPVTAGAYLWPGSHIHLLDGLAHATQPNNSIGIVDPFLLKALDPGDRFWLIVKPREITSLRHVWEHPAFPSSGETAGAINPGPDPSRELSEAWLRDWCSHADVPSYEAVMAAIDGGWHGKDGDSGGYLGDGYLSFGGVDASGDIPDEFWNHVEIVTGKSFPHNKRAYRISCSC
jgi:hypothetical protein